MAASTFETPQKKNICELKRAVFRIFIMHNRKNMLNVLKLVGLKPC